MAEIVWTEPALSDLEQIAEYIALENPAAAGALVQQVFTTVERLERHPASGKISSEFEHSRYREVVCGPCRVFYRHAEERVLILYVMRSERQLRNFILDARNDQSN